MRSWWWRTGLLLPPAALAAARLGCFNMHASLLPRWRGAAPIQRAILAGDATTGVTIMRMDAGLDTGPALAARAIDISPLDTGGQLARPPCPSRRRTSPSKRSTHSPRGRVSEAPQPQVGITYAAKISKSEALIDWREDAEQVLRRIRAFNPTPVAETRLDGVQLRIWEAQHGSGRGRRAGRSVDAELRRERCFAPTLRASWWRAAQGLVRIVRLQLAGRKPLAARDFIQARPLTGARFERS